MNISNLKLGELSPEARAFIARRHMQPRYHYWASMATWTFEETYALAVGIEPASMQEILPDSMVAPIGLPLREIREVLIRAIWANEVYEPISPPQFVEWAKKRAISIPVELESLIPVPENKKSDVEKTIEKSLGTRERATLLKIIISMAKDKYGYSPEAEKNGGVTRVSGAIERNGFKISKDTIRDKLQEAAKFLSPEFYED